MNKKSKYRFEVYLNKGNIPLHDKCKGCNKKVYENEDAWLIHNNITASIKDIITCSKKCADFWVLGHM